MKSLVLIILLLIFPAWSNGDQTAVTPRETVRFSVDELIGYQLTIVSKIAISHYSFMKDGDVLAYIGTVNGPVTALVLNWKIDRHGHLVMDFNETYQIWKKLSVQGDLIEIERSIGPTKPYRNRYRISPRGSVSAGSINDYPKNSFTIAELADSKLQFADGQDSKYIFNPEGSGTFEVNIKGIKLSEGERTFSWSVDQKGNLEMTWTSGRVMIWRKLSRNDDIIDAEFTEPPYPPTRETYRRSKL